MTTLDKLWNKTVEEERDVDMEDTQEKNQGQTNNNEGETTKNKKKPHDDVNNIQALFPMALRFKIQSASKADANKKHQEILRSIAVHTKHCEIYSKHGDRTSLKPDNLKDFDYHVCKNKRQQFHTTVHRIVLDIKYHKIKKNKNILRTLQEQQCHLQLHEWHSTEWDIISVGYISGCSPKHQSKDTLTYKLDRIGPDSPKYNLHATTLKLTTEGKEYQVPAYEIQCVRSHYNEVCEYIAKTCKVLDQTFIKYQWKHSNRQTYDNGIKKQIKFVDSIRTIPVYGIHPLAMELLYDGLVKDMDILEINSTNKTVTHGRWNIHVTLENFETQTKWFQNNLKKLYNDQCKSVLSEVPKTYVPEVRFNSTIVFQDNKADPNKVDPILSDATESVSSFSNTSIDSTSWVSVVRASNNKSYPTISTITTTNDLSTQMMKLSKSIEKICERLDAMEQKLNKQDEIIQRLQDSEKASASHMDRLSDILAKLEERTSTMAPRRLELLFEEMESNKRRNINSTPTKDRNRT